jgi:hypothetical protein
MPAGSGYIIQLRGHFIFDKSATLYVTLKARLCGNSFNDFHENDIEERNNNELFL